MSIVFCLVLFAISALVVAVSLGSKHRIIIITLCTTTLMFSLIVMIRFPLEAEDVVASESAEQHSYQLVPGVVENRAVYLAKKSNNYQCIYVNQGIMGRLDAPIEQTTINYTDENPYVVITDKKQNIRREWWIFHEPTRQGATSTQYEIFIPNSESII